MKKGYLVVLCSVTILILIFTFLTPIEQAKGVIPNESTALCPGQASTQPLNVVVRRFHILKGESNAFDVARLQLQPENEPCGNEGQHVHYLLFL